MKKCLFAVAAFTAVGLCTAAAQAENRAGTFALSPFIGGYTFDGVQQLEPSLLYGLRAGYNITRNIGIEGVLETAPNVEADNDIIDAKMLNYRLEALYHFLPENRFVPFLAAGYGGIRMKYEVPFHNTRNAGIFGYGLGAKYFVSDNVALRADARQLIIDSGPTNYNYEYTVGASFIFGGSKSVPPPAEPAPVSKAVEPAPVPAPPAPTSRLTVSPATVVLGNPATLNWTSTNTSECSLAPNIGGVQTVGSMSVTPAESTDYSLSCSGAGGATASKASLAVTRPAPVVVDSDMDGVPDSLDKCPGTPTGVKVDKNGCPVDSDKDGVPDYLDKCPDTPAGVIVGKDGCPPVVQSSCKSITLEIEFDTAKADIKPIFDKEIKKVADMLKDNSEATAVIEGHTDNVGAADMNMKLSDRRANSVKNYLVVKFGIAAARLTAKGYGLTKPRASNKTAQGRHENRRVEAVIFCGGKALKATDHDTHK